eukprot:TRINITY_DN32004_c0_g1_i1.p3 TRINITY_DN32004_c0_g1~~TRINITY_DN32004_c0_g1_i1.p3  ORF type:complete len:118 (+),score=30.14 TRINITY_DN32004_c0_g1_i1:104-457(+)
MFSGVVFGFSQYVTNIQRVDIDKQEYLQAAVKHVKVAKAFDKEMMKIEVGLGQGPEAEAARTVWRTAVRLMCSAYGAQRKNGLAPAGNNQRQLVTAMRRAGMIEEEGEGSRASRHDW